MSKRGYSLRLPGVPAEKRRKTTLFGLVACPVAKQKASHSASDEEDEECEEDEEDEEEEEEDTDSDDEELKMVLIVRKDLKMGVGKIAAQCCHAAVGVIERIMKGSDPTWRRWYATLPHPPPLPPLFCVLNKRYTLWNRRGCTKVALKLDSQEAILDLRTKTKEAGVPYYLVSDAGRTQIAAGSKTVLSVGPAPISKVDAICGHLKLL